jgi:predicted AlkP superfamily phosphohydrolase/phosphomutase
MSRTNVRAVRWLGLVLLLGGSLLMVSGCGRKGPDPRTHRLLVIGIDSADWGLLDPLCEAGRMPNLQAFRKQAASGRMLTFRPLEKSPVLWASICTGVRPSVHGVGGFVKGREQVPVRGSAWQAPALWDLLGASGRTSAVIGMWTTYPARPIAGVMVSDYLPYAGDLRHPLAGLVTPDSLAESLVGLQVDPAALPLAELGRFLPSVELTRAEEDYPEAVADLRSIYAADASYLAVARWLAVHGAYDLFFFYLRGPDMISHKFWRYMEPDKSPQPLSQEEVALFAEVVPRYYEWVDEVVGEVLGWFPPDCQAVILSDHGFHGPRRRGDGWHLGTQEHSPFGIFLVRSPLYEAGARFDRLELLDIMPTFLALLGLPPSAEMPGRILSEALTDAGRKRMERLEANRVPSYQALTPRLEGEGTVDPEVDEQIRRQLRSLGYIE